MQVVLLVQALQAVEQLQSDGDHSLDSKSAIPAASLDGLKVFSEERHYEVVVELV